MDARFAYDLTPEAWRGDINGRRPRLTYKKALIIQTTIFDKHAYDAGLREAMRMVIDEFTLTYPEIKNVEHEYSTPCTARTTPRGAATWNGRMPWVSSSEVPSTIPLTLVGDLTAGPDAHAPSPERVEPAEDGPLRAHCHADPLRIRQPHG